MDANRESPCILQVAKIVPTAIFRCEVDGTHWIKFVNK